MSMNVASSVLKQEEYGQMLDTGIKTVKVVAVIRLMGAFLVIAIREVCGLHSGVTIGLMTIHVEEGDVLMGLGAEKKEMLAMGYGQIWDKETLLHLL